MDNRTKPLDEGLSFRIHDRRLDNRKMYADEPDAGADVHAGRGVLRGGHRAAAERGDQIVHANGRRGRLNRGCYTRGKTYERMYTMLKPLGDSFLSAW